MSLNINTSDSEFLNQEPEKPMKKYQGECRGGDSWSPDNGYTVTVRGRAVEKVWFDKDGKEYREKIL